MGKDKRKAVLSQAIVVSVTWKKEAEVEERGAKVSQFQDTTMLRRTSWMRPRKRVL